MTLKKPIRFLVLVLLLGCANAAFGQGPMSLVQQVEIGHGTQTGTYPHPPTATFPSTQAAGDTNVIIFEYCGLPGGAGGGVDCTAAGTPGPAASVTDTAGNTYTRNCGPITTLSSGSYTNACGGGTPTVDGRVVWIEVWSAPNIQSASAGNVVTVNMPNVNNMTGWNIWMFQIHPASGTVVFDQSVSLQSGNTSTGNQVAGPISTGTTPTTTFANEFFFAWCGTDNGTCPTALNTPPWTEVNLNCSVGCYDTHSDAAYEIVSNKQTASESFTAGSGINEWLGMLVTFGSAPYPPTNIQVTVQ